MKILTIPVTAMQENTCIYYDEESREGVMIDPGGEESRLLSILNENEIRLCAILLTHGHYDHIIAAEAVRRETGAPVLCHEAEKALLTDANANMSARMSRNRIEIKPDQTLADGGHFAFGGAELLVLHTPGHTPGGVCYYHEKEKTIFVGDTLFYESIGRSDFPYGDGRQLLESIRTKLMTLPDDTAAYPGHGQATTIGHERKYNPFLRQI